MNHGFSLTELLVAITLLMTILTMVLSTVVEGVSVSKNVTGKQDLIESLFYTVDSIKNDLTKCGMRLQEAVRFTGFKAVSGKSSSLTVLMGTNSSKLSAGAFKSDSYIFITDPFPEKKRKKIIIYDTENCISETASIADTDGDKLILTSPLKNDYPESARVILLKSISYKYFPKQKVLKKKVDSGYYQPMIESVTDFFITYFEDSNSVLYRIEVGHREQVRGYIFLSNLSG